MRAGTLLARRYRVENRLGTGGLATTFEATDLFDRERVALKLLTAAPELVQTLRQEFELLCGREHPHLSRVRDFGYVMLEGRPSCFYTADLIDGVTLDRYAREAGHDGVRRAMCDALMALAWLHAQGIRHGDFKPSNVLVSATGRGVLIDLSCASRIGAPLGAVSGTPGYLAPEVRVGCRVDERADLYSVGVTLRALGATFTDESCQVLIERCLAEEPSLRPSGVEEAIEVLGGTPVARRRFQPSIPLLERDAILAQFDGLLDELLEGKPGTRVWWIQGGPGSGKSRLLRALKWRAQVRSDTVEARAERLGGVVDCLERATGKPLPPAAVGVIEGLSILAETARPWVLVFDDVERCPLPEREHLDALIRLTSSNSRLLVLCASRTPVAASALPHARTLELEALSVEAIQLWASPLLSLPQARAVHERTGGRPGLVEEVLVQLHQGTSLADALAELTAEAPDLTPLSEPERVVVAALAICGGELDRERCGVFGVDEPARAAVTSRNLARFEGSRLRLVCAASHTAVLAALDPPLVRRLLDRYGHWLAAQTAPERVAVRIEQCLDFVGVEAAGMELRQHQTLALAAPWAFRRVARRVAESSPAPEVRVCAARALLEAGDLEPALALLEPATCVPELAAEVTLLRGDCQLRLGRPADAQATLATLAPSLRTARHAELVARAHLAVGHYREAGQMAEAALASSTDIAEEPRLREVAGLAAAYVGETERARALLRDAGQRFEAAQDLRGQCRVHLSLGIAAFRDGDVANAIEHDQRAVALAERQGLTDQLATALLNLGTARQKSGNWGGALAAYERALHLAVAVGKQSSETTLGFNIGNLYLELGLFERAQAAHVRTRELAEALGLSLLGAPLLRMQAELSFWRSELSEARTLFEAARTAFGKSSAARDVWDTSLWLAETRLREQDLVGAARELDGHLADISRAQDPALEVRFEVIRARLLLAQGAPRAALEPIQLAQARAQLADLPELVASVAATFADVYEQCGAPELASEQLARARRAWQRIAVTLPDALRDAFALHPLRRRCHASPEPEARQATAAIAGAARTDAAPVGAVAVAAPPVELERFLAVNRALNSSLSVDQVFENAMDAAIALTSAERGFLLLRKPELTVAAARNLDRERVGRSHLKFSRSIAEQVIATNVPVVTTDAGTDPRFFGNQSVHAMRLKSVVCVPIRSPDGVEGALYLDNRFEMGRFGTRDLGLLQAFADQVAIALTNARLHAELAARTAELEAAHAQIQSQVAGQAQQIARLTAEVEARQQALEYRFDYSRIVGRSAPMRALFQTLERVIDTDLPVLIQGESGTGKELVARAIHFNSVRKRARLVSVNCAALPESLLESELFGFRRGAFTGAERDHEGLMAQAARGTLFLDEIAELPLLMQSKFLRVLQDKEVRPLGSDAPVAIDTRIVCATNRQLAREVERGHFRQDLYYRIGVVELTLPPLRERLDDLPLIVDHLLQGKNLRVSAEALERLYAHPWPGNVRELENVLARASVLADRGEIEARHVVLTSPRVEARLPADRKEYAAEEAHRIHAALVAARWNVSRVARRLGIPRQTLYRKLERYGIERLKGSK